MYKSFVRSAIVMFVSALLVNGGVLASSGDDEVILRAKQELASALGRDRPDISDWTITPLATNAVIVGVSNDAVILKVLKTGSRSAVRASWVAQSRAYSRLIWFSVVGKKPVLVATRDLSVRQSLSSADVTLESRDVMPTMCSPLGAEEQVVGMRTRSAMRSGVVVCSQAVELQPSVARGDRVLVHYQSPRVSLAINGIAQQDGNVGQTLKVTNPATKGSFSAIVSGFREVVIHE